MRVLQRTLATAAIGALCATIEGQQVCEAILKSANYNQYHSLAQNQQYSLQKANFCLAEYEKASSEQRAQVEASYKLFSGGASGSSAQVSERQKQECDSKYGEYWFNQLGLQSQKVVSDKAMETVARCVEALRLGLRVVPTLSEDEKVIIVALTWMAARELPFRGIVRAPDTAVSCYLDGRDTDAAGLFTRRAIKPGASVVFKCERKPTIETISGERVECLPPALIAIDVLESPITLNLFRKCSTDFLLARAREVEASVAALRAELKTMADALQGRIGNAEARIGSAEARIPTRIELTNEGYRGDLIHHASDGRCPDGEVETGFHLGISARDMKIRCARPQLR